MAQQRRKQSLGTALRHVRSVIKRAEQLDFTTKPEDVALNTVYAAVTKMYGFLQSLSQDESICDCWDRGWHGKGHDTECSIEQIGYILSQIGTLPPIGYYVVFIDGDVEPYLHGPFNTEKARDKAARKLRAEDRQDPKSGIYRLDCTPALRVEAYSGAFFED
jgi:hypothetical protein